MYDAENDPEAIVAYADDDDLDDHGREYSAPHVWEQDRPCARTEDSDGAEMPW